MIRRLILASACAALTACGGGADTPEFEPALSPTQPVRIGVAK